MTLEVEGGSKDMFDDYGGCEVRGDAVGLSAGVFWVSSSRLIPM